jgi:hypothetical protein
MTKQIGMALFSFIGLLFVGLITLPYYLQYIQIFNSNDLSSSIDKNPSSNNNDQSNFANEQKESEANRKLDDVLDRVSNDQKAENENPNENLNNSVVEEARSQQEVPTEEKPIEEEVREEIIIPPEVETLGLSESQNQTPEVIEAAVDPSKPYFTPNELGNYEEQSPTQSFGPGKSMISIKAIFEFTSKSRFFSGENGEPLDVSQLDSQAVSQSTTQYGYNVIASDQINLDRRIKDFRSPE